ncbi:hypothetical protein ACFQX9_01340 [Bradyrhizobium sp. GCM10028915]|uniref:hypothetical protein n=1 Tax=unclassified Bradyrhizobium TaxID=2631580 RepID=UPI00361112C1
MAKRQKQQPKQHRYERRIVLFLDFLGFREIVDETERDSEKLRLLLRAIDRLYDIGREDADLYRTRSITTFSDSVVLSYAIHEQSAVFYLLCDIAFAVIDLAIQGYLVRGAITVGELVHTKRYLVGPAMVKAYEMESKLAKYPRVLIDRTLVTIARKAHAEQHDGEHEADYVRAFMTKDEDGNHYLNYVSWKSVVEVAGMDDDNYPLYLRDIGLIVKRGLAKTDAGVLSKYVWIHAQYVAAIEQFEKLGSKHHYRLNNPENCAAIEALPKLTDEAKQAKGIIRAAQTKHAK